MSEAVLAGQLPDRAVSLVDADWAAEGVRVWREEDAVGSVDLQARRVAVALLGRLQRRQSTALEVEGCDAVHGRRDGDGVAVAR